MKMLKIISLSIILFIFCLSTSIFIKKYLCIDGDYLSAFATLVAAMVAYYLFSDWRVEHTFKLIEQYHTNLKNKSINLNNSFDSMSREIFKIEGSTVKEGEEYLAKAWLDGQKFYRETENIIILLTEYEYCIRTLKNNSSEALSIQRKNLEFHIEQLKNISSEYFGLVLKDLGNFNVNTINGEVLKQWKMVLIKFESYCSIELAEFYFSYLNEKN
ncbi:hypothetical protein [Acinetobacter sp. M5A5_2a]